MAKSEWTYRKFCPFCGKEHYQRFYINIICSCGAKYYFNEKKWLHRVSGERKDDADN